VLALSPLLALLVLGTSYADAPAKTGWWNSATANGVALPMPTTAAGDLHVSQGPSAPTAYAAVGYDLYGQAVSGATLKLKVAANSAVGTVDVLACPTKSSAWKAGDDQPYDTAPAYDCALGSKGIPSADGASFTFLLDSGQLLGGSAFSLAIVPNPTAGPFSVDFVKPDATSLAPEVAPVEDTPAEAAPAPAAPAAPPAGTSSGSGSSGTVPLTAAVAPVTPVTSEQAPAVAAQAQPSPQVAPAAAAPAAAATSPVSNRDRYAAGTGLALLAGFLVWAFQQRNPQPRLLGGMARKAGPAAVTPVDPRPRGIGRFATLRTEPARRLV
jgi:hypothetical protein